MDKMSDLKALLRYDAQMLLSMEEQIIDALPAMIDKASSRSLKNALQQHLSVTKQQRDRVNKVRNMLGATEDSVKNYSGVLANLTGAAKCKGMEGIIDEAQKVMGENLSDEVMDAAIIAGAQKVEHYEMAAYGTARTYAQELGLIDVAQLLQQTLIEEHDADDRLSSIAENKVNKKAEAGNTPIL